MTNPKIKGKPCPACGKGRVCTYYGNVKSCRYCYFKWKETK